MSIPSVTPRLRIGHIATLALAIGLLATAMGETAL
jgi:hypothetical protein